MLSLESHNEIVVREGGHQNLALHGLAWLGYSTFRNDGKPAGRDELLEKPIPRTLAARNPANAVPIRETRISLERAGPALHE